MLGGHCNIRNCIKRLHIRKVEHHCCRGNGCPQTQLLLPGIPQTWESLATSTPPALLFQRVLSGTFQPRLSKTEIIKIFKIQSTNVPLCLYLRPLWDGTRHCPILSEKGNRKPLGQKTVMGHQQKQSPAQSLTSLGIPQAICDLHRRPQPLCHPRDPSVTLESCVIPNLLENPKSLCRSQPSEHLSPHAIPDLLRNANSLVIDDKLPCLAPSLTFWPIPVPMPEVSDHHAISDPL